MPNHVRNKVKMTGIANLPLFTTKTDEYTKEQFTFFDFNKLIPMPESLNIGGTHTIMNRLMRTRFCSAQLGATRNRS